MVIIAIELINKHLFIHYVFIHIIYLQEGAWNEMFWSNSIISVDLEAKDLPIDRYVNSF